MCVCVCLFVCALTLIHFVFVYVFPDPGHGLTAWLIVMKSRPAQAHRMRKTLQSSQMTQLEQMGENEFIYILCSLNPFPILCDAKKYVCNNHVRQKWRQNVSRY